MAESPSVKEVVMDAISGGGTDGKYFGGAEPKRGEMQELKEELNNVSRDKVKDAVKKVPSAMQAVYPRLVEAAVGQLSFLGGDGQVEGCPVPHVDKVLSLEVHERAESSQSDFLLIFFLKIIKNLDLYAAV